MTAVAELAAAVLLFCDIYFSLANSRKVKYNSVER